MHAESSTYDHLVISALAPVRWFREFGRPPRIVGLDIARGLAILGMVGAHVGVFEYFQWEEPGTWLDLVHGRSSILFAMLAGVSIALMTGRSVLPERERMPSLRLNLLGRGAVIFLIGLALELLSTQVAVILTLYGVLYIAMIPFLRWRPWKLLVAAAVLAILGPALLEYVSHAVSIISGDGAAFLLYGTYPITAWMALVLGGMALGRMRIERVRTAVVTFVVGVVLAGVGYGLGGIGMATCVTVPHGCPAPAGFVPSEDTTIDEEAFVEQDYVPGIPAVISPDDGDPEVGLIVPSSLRHFVVPFDDDLPAGGGGAESSRNEEEVVSAWEYSPGLFDASVTDAMLVAFFSADPHSGGTAEILGSGGFALVVIASCLLLSRPLRWILLPLGALGSMPLTAYTAHVVSLFVIAGPGGYIASNTFWAATAVGLLLLTTLWSMFFGRGPLERLVGRGAAAMAAVPRR